GELDARTDVFALGCVLHALLTGRSPLARENAMAELVAGRPLHIDASLPDDVFDIIVKATRLLRADRHASAAAAAEALGAALARRISRDTKTVVREWLDRVHGDAPPKRGRLDGLLDLEMVLAPGGGGSEAREFQMRPAETPTEEEAPPPRRR